MSDLTKANERAWDLKTPHHLRSEFYDIQAFLDGALTLKGLERQLCGDVAGLDLLHLQCHFGLDTLSWARLGARATGVDFSATAVGAARDLATRAGLEATFLKADVQRLPHSFGGRFDLVVSTYGALCWLADLDAWAARAAGALRAGGRLVLVEFHPFLDAVYDGCITNRASYCDRSARRLTSQGTYASREAPIEFTEYLWQHPVSEVVTTLVSAGLRLDGFSEYPFCSYPIVADLDVEIDGYWRSSRHPDRFPYLYSLVASK